MNPRPDVAVDLDGARHAIIASTADSTHSGFIIQAFQERRGLPQLPLGVTRFRVTFPNPGIFPYICALPDDMGMVGQVTATPYNNSFVITASPFLHKNTHKLTT